MTPLYLACLWCVYSSGRQLFSPRVGLWAAVCAGAWPQFFITSTEFRTDDLWAVLWLASLTIMVGSPLTIRRAFVFGLFVGASFATSMKTSVLALALVLSLVFELAKSVRKRELNWPRLRATTAAVTLGLILLPALIIAFFASRHALPGLYYGTIQHNALAGLFKGTDIGKRISLIGTALGLGVCTWISCRGVSNQGIRSRIAVSGSSVALYLFLIGACWPLIQVQDYLPVAPFAVLLVLAAVASRPLRLLSIAPPLCAMAEFAALLFFKPPRPGVMADKIKLIANVLSLTSKDEYIMDAKGEAIYRRRPFYFALEGVTLRRIQLNLIDDDIPEKLIETRTPLATLLRMPERAKMFITANYLPISFRLCALGKILSTGESSTQTFDFDIAVPAEYAICAERGKVAAECDGTPFKSPKFLAAGHHRVQVAATDHGRIALIWARALERGFSPFAPIKADNFGGAD